MSATARRIPKQARARVTVEAVLDAVVRILKREGARAVTTNRVAEVAGVSVGSVYQYFPDKQAIYAALHDRHVREMSQRIDRTLVDHASDSLEGLVRALVTAMVDAHASDPELHELLTSEIPNRGGARAFETRLRDALKLALAARRKSMTARETERVLFVLPHLIEAFAHGAARPGGLSLGAAREEAVRAVLAYLAARN
ncbi:MAG TPA: TetR/AcrR family transcriptional regulator [Polyangiaceae bacterium]|nr:TetR/AcrR family transcriptional regulator [Polyangiaceae bacterium]